MPGPPLAQRVLLALWCVQANLDLEQECSNSVALLQHSKEFRAKDRPWPQIWVINLDSRPDRWSNISQRLAELPLERFPATPSSEAVDAAEISPKREVAQLVNSLVGDKLHLKINYSQDLLNAFGFTETWTAGEMACAQSHIRLWRKIAEGNSPAMILEDDVMPADSDGMQALKRTLEVLRQEPQGPAPDLVYLSYTTIQWFLSLRLGAIPSILTNEKVMEKFPGLHTLHSVINYSSWRNETLIPVDSNHTLRRVDFMFNSAAYVLWPSGARRLLQQLPLQTPLDTFIGQQIHLDRLFALAVDPPVLRQDFESPGDVKNESCYHCEQAAS